MPRDGSTDGASATRELYFDSGPGLHRSAYELLQGFGDESADYLWKVLASEQILKRYRDDPRRARARPRRLATNKATMEEVFHPENETEVFDTPATIADATDDGELAAAPDEPGLGWEPDHDIGELAGRARPVPGALPGACARRRSRRSPTWPGWSASMSGAATPLQVTSAVRDRNYQDLLVQSNPQATAEYSLHTTGWAFDIRRDYESKTPGARLPVRARPPALARRCSTTRSSPARSTSRSRTAAAELLER